MAAAAGAGFDLTGGAGGFVVDIGGGTTEVAAVAGWRVVRACVSNHGAGPAPGLVTPGAGGSLQGLAGDEGRLAAGQQPAADGGHHGQAHQEGQEIAGRHVAERHR